MQWERWWESETVPVVTAGQTLMPGNVAGPDPIPPRPWESVVGERFSMAIITLDHIGAKTTNDHIDIRCEKHKTNACNDVG